MELKRQVCPKIVNSYCPYQKVLKKPNKSLLAGDVFSIGTRLERVGFSGSVRWLWALDSFTKTRNKKDQRCKTREIPISGKRAKS